MKREAKGSRRVAAAGQRRGRPPAVPEESAGEKSATALVAEALRTGVLGFSHGQGRDPLPHEGERIRVGDPDDDAMANEYVGEETPGGSASTPDQSSVDEIGRAYGLQDEDAGSLRSAAEVLTERDRHRPELRAPRRKRV